MSRSRKRSPRAIRFLVGAVVLGVFLLASVSGFLRWNSAVGELTGERPGVSGLVAFLFPARVALQVPATSDRPYAFVPVPGAVTEAFRQPADPQLIAQLPTYGEGPEANPEGRQTLGYTPEPDRLNLLLLGTPGPRQAAGSLLTDAIVIASLDQRSKRVAAISIPRDLYVSLPDMEDRHKINSAYAIGERRFGDGLAYAMETVSQVAGVPIHHGFRIHMTAFKELVDALGGVDVRVHRDFTGTDREGISVQRGLVHMDGEMALAYARSRKTTDDFDRSRRQREVLVAIRKRLADLRNPFEMLDLLEILARHAESTLSVAELRQLYELYTNGEAHEVIDLGFDTSAGGRLQAMRSLHGEYILVPRAGEFREIQNDVRSVFERAEPGDPADASD